jgi:hypothetical protein
MGITIPEASLLALFLETLFYGALPSSGRSHNIEFLFLCRRVLHLVLVDAVHTAQEMWCSTELPYPSSNLAALHCNGRKCDYTLQDNNSTRSLAPNHRSNSSARGVRIQCEYKLCGRLLLRPRFTVGTRKNRTLHHAAHYR